ncbi:MAG: hypothetical protein H7Y37_04555 [Anaerolineae bacterium]|nr:hypothetical protein [Gloeobacterales cyanobacterium ES-bin-313]
MGRWLGTLLAASAVALCLTTSADAQTLMPGSSYRVTTKNAAGTTAVYCYRFLEGSNFEVSTTTFFPLTTAGTWELIPTAGRITASFFQGTTTTPVSTSTYIGAAYVGPSTGASTISGTVLTDVSGTIVPVIFTGTLDPTCAQ